MHLFLTLFPFQRILQQWHCYGRSIVCTNQKQWFRTRSKTTYHAWHACIDSRVNARNFSRTMPSLYLTVTFPSTYDKHFLPAQKARRLVQQDFDQVFIQPNILNNRSQSGSYQTVHAILTPCAISAAPSIEECTTSQSAAEPYLNDVMTVPASLAGLPAISVPFGESNGYPVGLQLITQYGYDRFLLQLAQRLINDSTN